MSDIEPLESDDESRLMESFDQAEIKFSQVSSAYRKKDLSGTTYPPNQSIEFHSTTYVSTSKKVPGASKTELEPDLEIFDNDSLGLLSDSDSESKQDDASNDSETTQTATIPKDEELKMIYARNFITKVDKNFRDKDTLTKNIRFISSISHHSRNEIVQCKQRLRELEDKRDLTFRQLDQSKGEDNVWTFSSSTVYNRLDREHANLCNEIELEARVLTQLNENYDKADDSGISLERSRALLEKTKYAQADNELKKTEDILRRQKDQRAAERAQTEQTKVASLMQKLQRTKKLEEEKVRIENLKQKETIEQSKIARQVANQYLQTTLREMKEKKMGQETQVHSANELKRRDVLNLKQAIDQNREIFQARVNKKKFLEAKKNEQLEEEKKRIVERGENPNFFIPRKLKIDEFERTKNRFEQEQETNRKIIVKKIVDEDANMEKKKRLYPNLFNINLKPIKPSQSKAKTDLKKLNTIAKSLGLLDDKVKRRFLINMSRQEDSGAEHTAEDIPERRSFVDTTTIASREDEDSDFDELNNQEEVLIRPEFEGLWNKKTKIYDVDELYRTQFKFPASFKTKAERELYLKSLEKLKKSAIKDQVAAGKKFKGVSFKSQPRMIEFKDFDVGSTYNLKVVLTNISYTINTCKLIGISDKLKDFITIDFKPPGQMSAGLTCEFNVTFEPKINKDLEGEIEFLSTNGPFSLPIKCLIKKCEVSVNTNSINFGTIVIGEKLVRKIQLINKGALGTNFELIKMNQFKNQLENPSTQVETNDTEGIEIGRFQDEFVLKFDDPKSKEIVVSAKATSIDVPIWIENINVDLKICMYDRLYQDVLRVHNRANAALRITFEVPDELKNHLEILPKTAFIQAKSEFLAQMKFTAKKSLSQDAPAFFDEKTGVVEVPLFIQVADQNKTVNYSMHAIITTSDMEFDTCELDFGYCTIYETVKATVNLTNKSILCQAFGFVKLPEYVTVQPNDGFGTLLPNETIQLDINFSPKLAKNYSFAITCKSLVNRDFVINCRGVGVHPPLRLSSQRVNFKATCLNSVSWRTLYVINDHMDYDQHRHPVPRIGDGEMAVVGPTYFEMDVPPDAPFEIWPRVGCVEPGKKVKLTMRYTASLNENDVKLEAARLMKQRLIEKSIKGSPLDPNLAANSTENIADGKPPAHKKKPPKVQKTESSLSLQADSVRRTPDANSIDKNSLDYISGLQSALSSYQGGLRSFQIPCYISSKTGENNHDEIYNTIYLDVVCPSIKPEMMVISKNSSRTIDFGKASVGQKAIRKVVIKNISKNEINLTSNVLDPNGPFVLLNSLRPLMPGQTHTLILAFIPHKSSIFQESFELRASSNSNLEFFLNAVGVEPSFSLSFDGQSMDFGYCLAGEKSEKVIEMKNNSKVPIEFKVTLDSDKAEHVKEAELKRITNIHRANFKPIIGPQNYFGSSSFDVYPVQGSISPGSKVDLKVAFQPDHTSELYSDTMRIIMVSNEKNSKVINLNGKSRTSNMYVRGVEYLSGNMPTESMVLVDVDEPSGVEDKEEAGKKTKGDKVENKQPRVEASTPIPIVVTLYAMPSLKNSGEYAQAEKTIFVGCMRSTSEKKDAKRSGDFTFDSVKEINAKGFNIDLTRSAVEAGGERQVKITWKPQPGMDVRATKGDGSDLDLVDYKIKHDRNMAINSSRPHFKWIVQHIVKISQN